MLLFVLNYEQVLSGYDERQWIYTFGVGVENRHIFFTQRLWSDWKSYEKGMAREGKRFLLENLKQ